MGLFDFFGKDKDIYSREKYDEAVKYSEDEEKKASLVTEEQKDETRKNSGHIHKLWQKMYEAKANVVRLYEEGHDEAIEYDRLIDEARAAIEAVVDFEKKEFGMNTNIVDGHYVDLEDMDQKASNFLFELKKTNSEAAKDLKDKYEELRSYADDNVKKMLDFEKEKGIDRKNNNIIEI